MQLIDLSVALDADIPADPPALRPRVTYADHSMTAAQIMSFFPGLTKEQLPDGEGWAVELMQMSTHSGTHMDAPYHHHSTMNKALVDGGEPAATIDELPLDWFIRPGVKLDLRGYERGYVLTAKDVEAEFKKIDYTLAPLDIVLINTEAGARYGEEDYIDSGCGIGRDGTLWMLERGVRVTGTDAWSWDAPFSATAGKWAETQDPSIIWEGHRASIDIGYCHMEKLTNLDQLPSSGFKVSCFPFKVKRGSAGYVRTVAMIE